MEIILILVGLHILTIVLTWITITRLTRRFFNSILNPVPKSVKFPLESPYFYHPGHPMKR